MFYDVEIVNLTNKTKFLQIDAESGKIIKGLVLKKED